MHKVIIHSDESTDATLDIAKSFEDQRLLIVETKPRQGFASAFLRLLEISNTDITVILNDDIKIEDDYFLSKLAKPFLEDKKLGLACGNPLPFPPVNFVSRALQSSANVWYRMRDQINEGNNAFTADGKIMAISKEFKSQIIRIAPGNELGNVDAYIFMLCQQLRFNYKFVRNAVVHYKNPITWHDYFAWTIRNNSHHALLPKQFGALYNQHHTKPRFLYLRCLAIEFFKNPLGSMVIFFGSFYIRYKAKKGGRNFNPKWEVIKTSK